MRAVLGLYLVPGNDKFLKISWGFASWTATKVLPWTHWGLTAPHTPSWVGHDNHSIPHWFHLIKTQKPSKHLLESWKTSALYHPLIMIQWILGKPRKPWSNFSAFSYLPYIPSLALNGLMVWVRITPSPGGFPPAVPKGLALESWNILTFNINLWIIVCSSFSWYIMCMIKIFMRGGGGGRGGGWGGVAVKDAWNGVVRVGVIKASFQKHLNTDVDKGKSCS